MQEKEVPEGWEIVTIKEINTRKSKNINPQDFPSQFFESYSVPIFETGVPEIVEGDSIKSSKQVVNGGEILLCKINPRINRVWTVGNYSKFPKIASSEWIIVKPAKKADTLFLKYTFSSPKFRRLMQSEVSGVGGSLTRARPKIVENYPFLLPPLPEQKRIVAKLDTVFGHLEVLKEKLAGIPKMIAEFRQSVLTQAVTGKLTEEWRKGKDLGEWEIERADECCIKVQSGGTPKKPFFEQGTVPFLKGFNLSNQKIVFKNKTQFITEEAHTTKGKKSIALPGDVLMNIVGPPLNKIAIIPDTYPEWNHNQAITLFRTKKYLFNRFLYIFFREGASVRSVHNETRGVVGQVNISLSQCRAFEISIPPIKEQKEIVRQVDKLFTKADAIEARYTALKEMVDDLPQAVLGKAFCGELVD